MGSKRAYDSVAAIVLAFAETPRWLQHELAAEVGLKTEQLRNILRAMEDGGYPLSHKKSGNNYVQWTMKPGIFPQGIVFRDEAATELLRVLLTAAKTPERDNVFETVLALKAVKSTVKRESATDAEKSLHFLGRIAESAVRREPLTIRYQSVGSKPRWRDVSVLHTSGIARQRFLAVSHEDNKLKWFRVDAVENVLPNSAIEFQDRPESEVRQFEEESAWGYHNDGPAELLTFAVTKSCWNKIERNVPAPPRMQVVDGDWIHVTVATTAVNVWARYLVGYAADVRPENQRLRDEMAAIVQSAIHLLNPAENPTPPATNGRSPGIDHLLVPDVRRRRPHTPVKRVTARSKRK